MRARQGGPTLKRLIVVICALASAALLAVPAANAGDAHRARHIVRVAIKECAKEKRADPVAFHEKYGRHATRRCVLTHIRDAIHAVRAAARECRAEQAADPVAFREKYGNKLGRHAFRRCVAVHVRAGEAT
jgi:hypothetical protein